MVDTKISLVCEHVFSCQVKLSSKTGQNVDIVWTENGLLITATGEQVIRSVYTYCLYTYTVRSYFKLEYLSLFFLGCGIWTEAITTFCLSMRLWGLREERWSTVCHTVQEKVTSKYSSCSANSISAVFFFTFRWIRLFQDDLFHHILKPSVDWLHWIRPLDYHNVLPLVSNLIYIMLRPPQKSWPLVPAKGA